VGRFGTIGLGVCGVRCQQNGAMDNDRRPGEKDWWSACWLAATIEDVDPLEIRSHWNANEAPRIFALRDSAPRIELGPLYAGATDNLGVGPARRIFELLFLRGTTPEYALPVATDAVR
jgi:hypothetical protein